jgi:hypothetical protein
VGGLWVLEGGAIVWGCKPVRTIGGWSRVEMAFWPVSRTACDQVLEDESS